MLVLIRRTRARAREAITAARVWLFGVALAPVVGCELVIVHHYKHARHLGFNDRRRHPQAPHLRAWWPALGSDDLRGLVIHRVTLAEGVWLKEEACQTIQASQLRFGRQALWIAF